MALNKLMWNDIHCLAISTVIEPTCSNSVHSNQGSIYLFEVNNGNIGTTCEICLKLTIKTLNIFHNLLQCFYTWPWTSKYQLVLGANFTDKTKAFFHLLQSDANSEPVTNLGGRFCENI